MSWSRGRFEDVEYMVNDVFHAMRDAVDTYAAACDYDPDWGIFALEGPFETDLFRWYAVLSACGPHRRRIAQMYPVVNSYNWELDEARRVRHYQRNVNSSADLVRNIADHAVAAAVRRRPAFREVIAHPEFDSCLREALLWNADPDFPAA